MILVASKYYSVSYWFFKILSDPSRDGQWCGQRFDSKLLYSEFIYVGF